MRIGRLILRGYAFLQRVFNPYALGGPIAQSSDIVNLTLTISTYNDFELNMSAYNDFELNICTHKEIRLTI